jgi:hypothetical protein
MKRLPYGGRGVTKKQEKTGFIILESNVLDITI